MKILNDFRVKIFLGFLALSIAVLLAAFAFLKTTKPDKPHKYVDTIVTEKYIIPGYGGIYHHKDTEYVIVSEYYDEKGVKITVTTYATDEFYNHINVGECMKFCVSHQKALYFENNS